MTPGALAVRIRTLSVGELMAAVAIVALGPTAALWITPGGKRLAPGPVVLVAAMIPAAYLAIYAKSGRAFWGGFAGAGLIAALAMAESHEMDRFAFFARAWPSVDSRIESTGPSHPFLGEWDKPDWAKGEAYPMLWFRDPSVPSGRRLMRGNDLLIPFLAFESLEVGVGSLVALLGGVATLAIARLVGAVGRWRKIRATVGGAHG